ncbi:BCLAF1 and THRAP3 family member 3-like [Clarias magur]|uniref:BCLAF1 and THRAP3 family member 3-like n=1 Tax=Clarias magur TaxID=1594786 RepID=A0A8J4WWY2_CLAMG|nr:BCLAF1 and THRAP3 family member 3-like [Clarias magur]
MRQTGPGVTMSRHRSRSPLHSRNSALLGRRDGYYGEQHHVPVRSDSWRDSGNVDNRNTEGDVHWDNASSQAEEQVDHWAKFIEAIGRAEKRKAVSVSRYHAKDGVQSFQEDSAHSSRQLSRERLPSPETSHYSVEHHHRIQSPGQRRNEQEAAHADRRYSRSSSPRHSQAKRHYRMDQGYQGEGRGDRYERSSYSERSLKSNYTEHQLHFKEYQDLDPQEEYSTSHRNFSPHRAPVIVEHDHGIPKDDVRLHNPGRDRERPRSRDPARDRDHPRNRDLIREHPRSHDPVRDRERPRDSGYVRDREHPRNRDPIMGREHPRSSGAVGYQDLPRSHDPVSDRELPRSHDPLRTRDPSGDRDYLKSGEAQRGSDLSRGRESSRSKELRNHARDYNHPPGMTHGGLSTYHAREDASFRNSLDERGSPLRGQREHKEQPRMGSHPKEPHRPRAVDDRDFRMDERDRARASGLDWEEGRQPRRNHGGVLGQRNVPKRNLQHRNPSHPGARKDFASHETLKIKVDMSRPVGQSSHLGYSSERQLSLDLVNVGRQRLDFLPMLEHSGTFRETAVHSGTFAQEIITLVHQVKENYFQGQGISLNDRFSNEQEYSMLDDFAAEEQEMEVISSVVNRPLGSTSLDTQIFCKIGPLQSQRKPHVPAPGDLRHDLDRKRQERLEGVKITIAGGNFSQILAQSQERESVYVGGLQEASWDEDVPQQTEHWDDPCEKQPVQSFNNRRNFGRVRSRPGPRIKKNTNNVSVSTLSRSGRDHYMEESRRSCGDPA